MSPPSSCEEHGANFGSDLWATGVVLYELTTQKRPFDEPTEALLIDAILNKNPVPPKTLNADVPSGLEIIILRALVKDPTLRYQRAQDLLIDIKCVQAGLPVDTVSRSPTEAVTEQQSRVLEAAAQRESVVGRSTEVVAMVRCNDSGGLREYLTNEAIPYLSREEVRERPFKLHFESDAHGKLHAADIGLRLDSPDFEPRIQTKKLQVAPQGDSAPCSFLITPRIAGELVLNLELLNNDEQVLVSRSIRMKAALESGAGSVEQTVVSIPLLVVVHNWNKAPMAIGSRVQLKTQPTPVERDQESIGRTTIAIPPQAVSLDRLSEPPSQVDSALQARQRGEDRLSVFNRHWLLWTGNLALVLIVATAFFYRSTRPLSLPSRVAVSGSQLPNSSSEQARITPPAGEDVKTLPPAVSEETCPSCLIASPDTYVVETGIIGIDPTHWPKPDPASGGFSFGSVRVGQSKIMAVNISNKNPSGMLRIAQTKITGEVSHAFAVLAAQSTCNAPVAAGKECRLLVRFTPARNGNYKAGLQITGNGGSTQIALSGIGK